MSALFFDATTNYQVGRITSFNEAPKLNIGEYDALFLEKVREPMHDFAKLKMPNDVEAIIDFFHANKKLGFIVTIWAEKGMVHKLEDVHDQLSLHELTKCLTERMNQIIQAINNAKIEFIEFDTKDVAYLSGKLYGYFYDVEKNKYTELPKVTKKTLKVEEMSYSDIEEYLKYFLT